MILNILIPNSCNQTDYNSLLEDYFKTHKTTIHNKDNISKCAKCDWYVPEYDDLKKHIKTILEKDKNVDCKQCNLSTRAKWHLRAHVEISHKWFVISGYSLNLNLLLH